MNRISVVIAAALCLSVAPSAIIAQDQGNRHQGNRPGATQALQVTAHYIRLSADSEGLLLEPSSLGPNWNIALVFSHPNRDNFKETPGWEMAKRGYRVMLVNYRGGRDSSDAPPEDYLPSISLGIDHLRSLPGVDRVVLLAHSGGTHLGTLYQNVAENGPSACQGSEKIYPCTGEDLEGLQKPDGLILLDPTLGAAHQMTAVNPGIVEGQARNPELDMFAKENGFDVEAKMATYSPEFAGRFYAAQSARNDQLVNDALERLKLIVAGEGEFGNDEPLVIRGVGVRALGARPYQPDLSFLAHTKQPHLLLRSDGTEEQVVIQSVRPAAAGHLAAINELGSMNYDTTVRGFLANSAVRTSADYAVTADDIIGVDWASSYTSTPANAEGVNVPSLVLTMSCHYLVVPGAIIFDHLASADKSYASVEGATHLFQPCKPEYGDTAMRTFDFVDQWLGQDGRF